MFDFKRKTETVNLGSGSSSRNVGALSFLKLLFLPLTGSIVIMADFSTAYQAVLETTEEFMTRDGKELTEKNKERLERLSEISKFQANLKGEEDVLKEEASSDNRCLKVVKKICKDMLFGLYLECVTIIENGFSMIGEMMSKLTEVETAKLTDVMQVKFDEVKHNLENAYGRLDKIDGILSILVTKVRVILFCTSLSFGLFDCRYLSSLL